ncbi:SDR family oxidoreductase [Planctomicrobium sp. SH527]|uniref:SDR family oxidoreductase n=1 Tax=Planctomicrobium sp. SH527 TaxID=3448123 RepID=UPI003F5BE48C
MAERTITQLFSLHGKTVLLTGATGHLGSAMARGFAEAGARVVVSSRDPQKALDLVTSLPALSATPHLGVQLDHMSEESISEGFRQAIQQAGTIDILVNNGHEVTANDWSAISAPQFSRQLENLTGYFLLARHFHDHLSERKAPGSLIFIGSMYGVVGSYPDVYAGIGPANSVAYQALKGGVIQMTRHLAVYWAEKGIRVNCLSPGAFPSANAPQELVSRLVQKCPAGRIGSPEELKGAVVFLASDASSYMTGQNLIIDGGWTAW